MSGTRVRYEDFPQVAERVIKRFATEQFRDLVTFNPKRTGRTARGWTVPVRRGAGSYTIVNRVTTRQGLNLALSLNDRRLLLPRGARPTVQARNSRLRNVSFAVEGEGFIDFVTKGGEDELIKRLQRALEGMS
ncbi:MAG: hypothetical protein K0U41_04845 [Gammaproteobacteria bacterium]|nr:hypothetical protein [Gammaproteobacteria bacterium]